MSNTRYNDKKLNKGKLLDFGFIQRENSYHYSTKILDGDLEIRVIIDQSGLISTNIYDTESGDEYILHLVSGASGSYVGNVKNASEELAARIYNECFDYEVFSANQAEMAVSHVAEKYGEQPQYPFGEDTIVLKRADNNKWYAIFMKIHASKIGLDVNREIEVVNLKMSPCDVEALVDGRHYFAAYHMNKKHWVTIPFDTAIPTEELIARLDESRNLVGRQKGMRSADVDS